MKKESTFKMKGFSGFGNSPAKQKFDPYKKDNEAYDKVNGIDVTGISTAVAVA